MSRDSIQMRVNDNASVTRCVVEAGRIARSLGFDDHLRQMVATCVSELGHNIRKYARTGLINIKPVRDKHRAGIEVTARDRGPGIADLEQALSDRFSSGGTLGLGLPGVKRMMDEFEVDTTPGKGTTITVRKWL